ncbi:MAG TPA: alpha-amylase family glycosyl hydrolase [Acidobacteriaceae bacterium]|nr:alpha-amylase family glycosyl hydrolase [Acidobacteriaceae bacterium]
MKPAEAEQQMLAWKKEGITALEIFAPEEGGNSYDGLDTKDRFRLDPGLGSLRDFRNLVKQAHIVGLAVVTFQNLGYSSLDAPQFLKAENDIRAGRDTREARFFFWSKTQNAPPPAMSNSYFLIRPKQSGYNPTKNEFWQWSDRAQQYYWTRWPGKDAKGQLTHLPQYNWAESEWPGEAEKVVRFWMDTGLDGMILDAVNWYTGATWKKTNNSITEPISSYRDKLIQPEGGGAFHTDDPVGWVTEGRWTNLYDYGLGIWWEKNNQALQRSVETGNPQLLENALRAYHDRVVAVGGTLYMPVPHLPDAGQQQLAEALLATSGDLLCYCDPRGGITHPAKGIPSLLKLKAVHPALYQNSSRRQIPTNDDNRFYATLRDAADHSERLLIVFNFQQQAAKVDVDLGAINGSRYTELGDGPAPTISESRMQVQLPAYGHQIFTVK